MHCTVADTGDVVLAEGNLSWSEGEFHGKRGFFKVDETQLGNIVGFNDESVDCQAFVGGD